MRPRLKKRPKLRRESGPKCNNCGAPVERIHPNSNNWECSNPECNWVFASSELVGVPKRRKGKKEDDDASQE